MRVKVCTDDVAVDDRADYWRDALCRTLVPCEVSLGAEGICRGEMLSDALGAVQVSSITCSPVGARRTARLIRRSDPEIFRCDLQVRGHRVVDQGADQVMLGAGDFVFYDPSRPFDVHSAGDPLQRSIVLMFPRGLLPLAADHICRPAVVPVAGDAGIGALVSSFLVRLAGRLGEDDYGPADRVRLSTAVLDLLATALAGRLGCASSVPPETQRTALLHQIYTFAEQRLGDPELSPGLIAAAHHISIRYLQKLFEAEGATVAGWIRARRLDRCRRDLADPAQRTRLVSAIAARWGFINPDHFSRVFRATYGIPASEYRILATGRGEYADGKPLCASGQENALDHLHTEGQMIKDFPDWRP